MSVLMLAIMTMFVWTMFNVSYAWPEPVESVKWELRQGLGDYKIYASVNFDRIDIPLHTQAVNISIAVEMSAGNCPVKDITLYASMFGIPVVSRDGEVFPNNSYTGAPNSIFNTTVQSTNHTSTWVLKALPAGPLMLMAVMPRPDGRIKQKGLSHHCRYYLTTRVRVIHMKDEDVKLIHTDQPTAVSLRNGQGKIFSVQVPLDVVSYDVILSNCIQEGNVSDDCPADVSVSQGLGSNLPGPNICSWINGSCMIEVMSPDVGTLNYVVIKAREGTSITLNLLIKPLKCSDAPTPNTTLTSHGNSGMTRSIRDNVPSTCTLAGQLGREKPASAPDGSDFFDRFVMWDDHLTPHHIITQEVPDESYLARSFNLRFTDSGATLRLDLKLLPEDEKRSKDVDSNKKQFASVKLCLTPRRLESPTSCDDGYLVDASTERTDEANKDYVIVPYPSSGVWYMTMQSSCYIKDNKTSRVVPVSCEKPVQANVTLHLTVCVDGSCGEYGRCNLYSGGGLLYSACDCFSGWRGYGCNDDSNVESAAMEKLAVYLLTLSNLAFLPGIVLAITRGLYVEALVYTYNMFFSTFYHACDTSNIYQYCLLNYNTLSFADFFASLTSFWVTLMAIAQIPFYARFFLHVCGMLFIALGEVHNRHGLVEQMLPLVLGIAIVLLSWGYRIFRQRRLFPSRSRLVKFILPGVSLAGLGLVLNLALETDDNYKYVHSSWHVLEAMSICFLLPPHDSSSWKFKAKETLSIQSGDLIDRPLIGGHRNDEDPTLTQVTFQRADQMDTEGHGSRSSTPPDSMNGIHLHNRNRNHNICNVVL